MTDTDQNAPPSPQSAPDARDQVLLRLQELAELGADFMIEVTRRQREEGRWKLFKRIAMSVLVLGFVTLWLSVYAPIFGLRPAPQTPGVAVIPIQGQIGTREATADLVVPAIQAACDNPRMRALVLRITSPGGSPTDAERIGTVLDACRAATGKPVLAVIEDIGASAGYMIAMHADRIVANRYAQVGSIGAVMRGYDVSGAAERFGIRERVFASGDLKSGNGLLTANTEAQDAFNQSMVDQVATQFEQDLVEERGEQIKWSTPDLTSGRTWLAPEAHKIGLIDQVATFEQVLATDFPDSAINDFTPRRSIQDRLGLQAMLDHAVLNLWTSLQEDRLE